MGSGRQCRILRVASALVGVAIVAAAIVFLDEWYQIGVVRDDSLIRAYHLGSEAMLAHGGTKYQTADSIAAGPSTRNRRHLLEEPKGASSRVSRRLSRSRPTASAAPRKPVVW